MDSTETRPVEQVNAANSRPPALDLDKLEREGAPEQPFDFVHLGKRYILADPQEVDWQDLLAVSTNAYLFFKKTLPAEDHREFFDAAMPGWKMKALMRHYQDFYGLPDAGNAGGLPQP